MIGDVNEDKQAGAAVRERRGPREPRQKRSPRLEINGWVNLDKPTGISSTQAVGRLKFLFNAKKAGHAGTLDPLASGVLPLWARRPRPCPSCRTGPNPTGSACAGRERDRRRRRGDRRFVRRPAPAEIESLLPRFASASFCRRRPPSPLSASLARAPTASRAKAKPSRLNSRLIHVYRLELDIR